jgi:hypothetical protein
MSAVLLVKGTIAYGRLPEFAQTVGAFVAYRQERGWAVPEVLHGLAGPMNTVLMIFRYKDLSDWETECAAEREDAEFERIASKLPYTEGSLAYELYQPQV